ncbi:hypothetical protein O181_057028 [Austropuccinia psidii MF-1]|uniref:Uncharacterized protein n=1 Tax=Austropuccinia psidii MF-1 TaxID=1389203 RepID=A0A9Q3HU24_9BASI|nr:hypothetical protein [Austropuccinia psidii MF-1]
MEDITTRTRIARAWNKEPIFSRPNAIRASRDLKVRKMEKPPLKLGKCDSTSHLANYFTKKRINEIQLSERVEPLEEEEESGNYTFPSEEDDDLENNSIVNF